LKSSLINQLISWRWAFWIALSAAILLVPVGQAAPAQPGAERMVHIRASSFEFQPGVVHVEPGERVTIELVSSDVAHGIYLDGYNLSLTADPGQTSRLTFIADRSGSFRMRCSQTCGALHPFMIGKFVVGSNLLFWRVAALALILLAGVMLAPPAQPLNRKNP
jgi:heme/copper-type cytochrome/quinol oxidase subunit 2